MGASEHGSERDGSESEATSAHSTTSRVDRVHIGNPWKRGLLELRMLLQPLVQQKCLVTSRYVMSFVLTVATFFEYVQLFATAASFGRRLNDDKAVVGFAEFLERMAFFGDAHADYGTLVVRMYVFGGLFLIQCLVLALVYKLKHNASSIPSALLNFWALLTMAQPLFVTPAFLSFFAMTHCEMTPNPLESILLTIEDEEFPGVYCISTHAIHIILAAVFLIGYCLLNALQQLFYYPGFCRVSTPFDVVYPWASQMPLFIAKVMLSAALFFAPEHWITGLVGLACSLALSGMVFIFLPYKRRWMNGTRLGLSLSLIAAAVLSLTSHDLIAFYCIPCILLLAITIGFVAVKMRLRRLQSEYMASVVKTAQTPRDVTEDDVSSPRADTFAVGTESADVDIESASSSHSDFRQSSHSSGRLRPFEVVAFAQWTADALISRCDQHTRVSPAPYAENSEDPVSLVQNIFEEYLSVYPDSYFLKLQYVEFLLSASHESEYLYGQSRVHELLSSFETHVDNCPMYLQATWLSLIEVRRSCESTASIEIHTGLRRATRAAAGLLKVTVHFWESLLDEDSSTVVLKTLPVLVSDMEREELRALMIFKKLLASHGSNPSVLRAYAAFVETVQTNVDQSIAHQYYEMAERYENKQSRALSRTARGYGQKQRGIPSDDISEASRFRSSTDSRLEPRGSAESLNSLSDNPKRMLSNFNEVETGSSAQRSTKSRESKFADSRNRGSFNDSASMTSDNMRGKRGDQDSDLREDMRMFVEGKSFAVQRVNLAVYLSLLLIVAVTVAIYVVGQIHLDLIVEGGNLVDEAGDTRTSTQEVAYRVRCMESAAIGQLQANMSSFSRLLHESATSLESAATILFDHARAKEDLLKAWRRQDGAVVETYTPTTRSTGSLQMSAWDMYGWFVRQARTVADYNQSMFLPQSPNTAEFHQVIVNGPENVLDSVWTLIHRYEDMYDHVVQEERIMQWVLCGAILLIPLILVSFLYIPAMRSIERERNEILRLFLLVPKTQVGRICTQTKSHLAWISGGMLGDKDTGTDNEQSGVENGEHSERQARRAAKHRKTSHKSTTGRRSKSAVFFLSIRFAVVLVMATGLALALGAIVLSANYAFFAQAAEINYAGGRYAYVVRLTHLCSELIRNDVIYYTRSQLRERIQKGIAEIIELHDAVKYGSSKFKTPGSVGHLHAQDNLLFRPRCAQTAELRCMSLDAMFSLFVDRVREFITLADHDLFYGSAAFKYISEVGEIHLHYLLDESQRLYAEETAPIIDGSRKALGYVFGVSFPIIILLYVVLLHPVLNRVDKEVRRTRRMLAMVPLDVIGDVPAIEDFIRSHGRNDTTQEALENAVKESQQKTSSVLAASVDAVIEFDKELCITSVNPSAEKVLSCKATNVVGDTVDLFFPLLVTVQDAASVSLSAASDMKPASDLKANMTMLMSKKTEGGDGMVWETVIVRSDGQIFPAQVSLCIGRMQGDVYFAAFIRDLSVMKKQEQLLRTEREKSENLLSTILPKSIADRLKANDGPIVDTYDSVSVVFTDMVKFTETAAKMSPQAVIGLLSNLFSEMDNIAAKHGIEKIKALGDGYMGASGLFSRFNDHAIACVNWGHEVFAFLRKYNEQHATNIQFRIGIATGPVTAGVIGTSRLQFDIFGDTVNVASRMESHSIPGRIQVNRETYERIYDKVPCEERTITVKGKGEMTVFMVK